MKQMVLGTDGSNPWVHPRTQAWTPSPPQHVASISRLKKAAPNASATISQWPGRPRTPCASLSFTCHWPKCGHEATAKMDNTVCHWAPTCPVKPGVLLLNGKWENGCRSGRDWHQPPLGLGNCLRSWACNFIQQTSSGIFLCAVVYSAWK